MDTHEILLVRRRVREAFERLEGKGFIVRHNFSCCMSCAIAELADIAEKQQRDRAAYWHEQDEEHFKEGGTLHVRFCYLPQENAEADTLAVEQEIADQVAAALREAGLLMEWSGSPSSTIQVTGHAHP
jgi:hypothetical protein